MTAVVRKLNIEEEAFHTRGVVVALEEEEVVVDVGDVTYRARRAVSCLVEPEEGDEVFLGGTVGGAVYVLAILEREEGAALKVSAQGDLSLQAPRGKLSFVSAEGVDIVSARDVSLTALAKMKLRATEGNVFFDKLTYLGQKALAEVTSVKTFVGALDSVLERCVQRVKRSYRYVEQLDQLQADQIDHSAKQNIRLHSRNTLVTADEIVKMDSKQIHLG